MSNLQAAAIGVYGKISETFSHWYASLTRTDIKVYSAGFLSFLSVAIAASAGLAIAGWLMPLETQSDRPQTFRSDNSQDRVLKPAASQVGEPVKVASLNGQAAIPGGYPVRGFEKLAQNTETIVPRQSETGLNPYAVQKQQQAPAPATRRIEKQPPLAAPAPVAVPQQDDAGLRQLTDDVVARLERLKKQETENTDGNLAPATSDLRQAIEVLVATATSKGKSSDYIQSLIDGALTGRNAVPAALAGPDGKLDTRLLLKSVMPKKNAAKVGTHADSYMAALESESRSLSLKNSKPGKSAASKKKRMYIIVRKGDNLSKIALRVYGDPLGFARIYRANRNLLANVNILSIGQRLIIPR